jgi:hypothetical protein
VEERGVGNGSTTGAAEVLGDALAAAPDFIEPLEAWRVWRVVAYKGELVLASAVKRTIWPADEPLVAECLAAKPLLRDWLLRRPPHEAPCESCQCGIYATQWGQVGKYLRDLLPEARARVLGRVALWGTVIESERGFRASHAYPLALYVPVDGAERSPLGPDELARALERYRVPVEPLRRGSRHFPPRPERPGSA